MAALLEVSGVSVAFGGVAALQDVSFALQEGELLHRMPAGSPWKTAP